MFYFKKILLSFLLLLVFYFPSKLQAQTTIHIDRTGYKYDWALSNEARYGQGSFYLKVERTIFPNEKGYYFFYVYFYSNSFYLNGQLASTYITDVNMYMISPMGYKQQITKPFYVLVPPKSNAFNGVYKGAYLYSTDPKQIIEITWESISAY